MNRKDQHPGRPCQNGVQAIPKDGQQYVVHWDSQHLGKLFEDRVQARLQADAAAAPWGAASLLLLLLCLPQLRSSGQADVGFFGFVYGVRGEFSSLYLSHPSHQGLVQREAKGLFLYLASHVQHTECGPCWDGARSTGVGRCWKPRS